MLTKFLGTARILSFLLFASMVGLLLSTPPSVDAVGGYALRFYGHGVSNIDRVKIKIDAPAVPVDVGADFTLEFWMKASASDNTTGSCVSGGDGWINGHILFDRDVYFAGDYGDYGISLGSDGRLAFGVDRLGTGNTICSSAGTNVADGTWHHIAVTHSSSTGQLRIFIDGVQRATGTGPTGDVSYRDGRATSYTNDPYLVIGAEKHDAGSAYPSYNGLIDEVRLSNMIRYATDFSRPTQPFTTDANTVALYHLDEGPAGLCAADQTINDSSGASGGPSNGVCKPGGSGTAGPVWSTDTPWIVASNPSTTFLPFIRK